MTTHATSDSDLPLERLKLCATGCDVCTVYGEDVEYALSLIASLRVCCDERGAALEAIQRGASTHADDRHESVLRQIAGIAAWNDGQAYRRIHALATGVIGRHGEREEGA